jgi:Glycosyl hydrolase family 3 C-terminal domain
VRCLQRPDSIAHVSRRAPLTRDVKNVAIIGPHADSVVIGFAAYTYPAALQLLGAMLGGGETSMAGVGDSGSAWLPAEAKAAMKNELQDSLKVDLGDYVKRSYPAVSLAEAVRQLLPNAQVTTVAATGVVPSEPTDIPAAVAAAKAADVVILFVGGRAAWAGKDRTEGEGHAALRRRHPHRRDSAGAAAHRLRPGRPRAGRVEERLVRGPMSLLAYTGLSGELVMEPGPVELSAGSSSSDIRSSAKFNVFGKTRVIKGEDRAFLSVATVGS